MGKNVIENILESRQAMMTAVIRKAWTDPEFKEKLKSDPAAALKEEFGFEVEGDFKINVVEESSEKEITLVIPEDPTKEKELSDEELASVSGGTCNTYGANTCYPHTQGWDWTCALQSQCSGGSGPDTQYDHTCLGCTTNFCV